MTISLLLTNYATNFTHKSAKNTVSPVLQRRQYQHQHQQQLQPNVILVRPVSMQQLVNNPEKKVQHQYEVHPLLKQRKYKKGRGTIMYVVGIWQEQAAAITVD